MKRIQMPAPAKVNLTLNVDGRLDSGYHLIRSLICPLELYDSLEILIKDGISRETRINLNCSFDPALQRHHSELFFDGNKRELDIFEGKDNLAHRAATAFLDELESSDILDINISLLKNIPMQAGLGGGSSDAASVLLGLRTLLAPEMPVKTLLEIASSLGSDVGAFLFKSLIFIHGTGNEFCNLGQELLDELRDVLGGVELLILKPKRGMSTPLAYSLFARAPGSLTLDGRRYQECLKSGERSQGSIDVLGEKGRSSSGGEFTPYDLIFSSVKGSAPVPFRNDFSFLFNDFEPVVRSHCKEVEQCFVCLKDAGAKKCLLAGSGSSVVGLFDSIEAREKGRDFLLHIIPQGWYLASSKFLL